MNLFRIIKHRRFSTSHFLTSWILFPHRNFKLGAYGRNNFSNILHIAPPHDCHWAISGIYSTRPFHTSRNFTIPMKLSTGRLFLIGWNEGGTPGVLQTKFSRHINWNHRYGILFEAIKSKVQVQFRYTSLCTPSGASRVVCGTLYPLNCAARFSIRGKILKPGFRVAEKKNPGKPGFFRVLKWMRFWAIRTLYHCEITVIGPCAVY